MANVGTARAGWPLIGSGNTSSPTFAPIGTNSGLTAHGLVIAEGAGAFAAMSAGLSGQLVQSKGSLVDPAYTTATYPSVATSVGTILRADGTNWLHSTASYPDVATSTGTILRADGTNWVNSTATYPDTVAQARLLYGSASNVVGTLAPTSPLGGFPTYDGTNIVWFDPRAYLYEWDDFIAVNTTTSFSKLCWQRMSSSGGSIGVPSADQVAGRPGIMRISIGTTAGGLGGLTLVSSANNCTVVFGGGRFVLDWYMKIPTLSDGTDTFTVVLGFSGSNGSQNPLASFRYNSGVNSGNWQMITSQGGVNTQNSTTAADTNWHRYTIDMNAAGTSVGFFIDGVQLTNSPLVSNIPTIAVAPQISVIRTAGNSNDRWVNLDLFTMFSALTTSR